MSEQKPVYGWAMSFGKGYAVQEDIIKKSATGSTSPFFFTDGRDSSSPPFYTLGPRQCEKNCPFYNYTLPDTYPVIPSPNINPKTYWYLPFDVFDSISYNENELPRVPKPS